MKPDLPTAVRGLVGHAGTVPAQVPSVVSNVHNTLAGIAHL